MFVKTEVLCFSHPALHQHPWSLAGRPTAKLGSLVSMLSHLVSGVELLVVVFFYPHTNNSVLVNLESLN